MIALLLLSIVLAADPAYARPLQEGDVIEVWESPNKRWKKMKIERPVPFGDLQVVGEHFSFSVTLLAMCTWRWPGADTCISNTRSWRT
jgi:hypothetical protein